ncbi:MAG: CBS domain-containing protein [Actinomycetota bacterium]
MPVTIAKSETLDGAARLLIEEDIGALVVFEPRGIAGVISERDIVRAVADGFDLSETEVGEYMTAAPVVTDEDAVIDDAVSKMDESGIRHVVVVSGRDVTGMISMRDLIKVWETR